MTGAITLAERTSLRRRLRAVLGPPKSGRGKAADNAVFLMGERLLSLLSASFISVAVARHLGVVQFGSLALGLSIVYLSASVVSGGLSGIVVRELVRRPEDSGRLLGTTACVRAAGTIIALGLVAGLTAVLPGVEEQTRTVILLLAVGTLLRSMDAVEFWFNAQSRMRYVSMTNVAVLALGAVARLTLVAFDQTLYAFAVVSAAEMLLGSGGVAVMYSRRGGAFRSWTFDRREAVYLLGRSWWLLLSGVANTINLRVDQIMVGASVGLAGVGSYAVAARLSEVWYFFATALVASAFPALLRSRSDPAVYNQRLQAMYDSLCWAAIALAAVVTVIGPPVVRALYGDEFAEAGAILVVHIWAGPFVFMAAVFSKWLIAEDLLATSLVRHSAGAAINVGLNLVLIPRYGPIGAAYATVASYATASYLACFLTRRTRPAGIAMTRAFAAPARLAFTTWERRVRRA